MDQQQAQIQRRHRCSAWTGIARFAFESTKKSEYFGEAGGELRGRGQQRTIN